MILSILLVHAEIVMRILGLVILVMRNFQQMLGSSFLKEIPIVLETGSGSDGTHAQEIALGEIFGLLVLHSFHHEQERKSDHDSCILR